MRGSEDNSLGASYLGGKLVAAEREEGAGWDEKEGRERVDGDEIFIASTTAQKAKFFLLPRRKNCDRNPAKNACFKGTKGRGKEGKFPVLRKTVPSPAGN